MNNAFYLGLLGLENPSFKTGSRYLIPEWDPGMEACEEPQI
jgi:hypothetical protein